MGIARMGHDLHTRQDIRNYVARAGKDLEKKVQLSVLDGYAHPVSFASESVPG